MKGNAWRWAKYCVEFLLILAQIHESLLYLKTERLNQDLKSFSAKLTTSMTFVQMYTRKITLQCALVAAVEIGYFRNVCVFNFMHTLLTKGCS